MIETKSSRRQRRPGRVIGLVAVLFAALVAGLPMAGVQAVASANTGGSRLDHIDKINDKQWNMFVYSAAMQQVIQLQVIRPADTSAPRPTLYMLNGAGGGQVDKSDWEGMTDVVKFLGDKNVNAVIPIGGKYAYYTDWYRTDPVLGNNKWSTFLTKELPPIVNSALGTNGVNAIAGLSMAGTSVLSLAESDPSLYKAVATYSGCAQTSTAPGQQYVRLVVENRGGGKTVNMWGPPDDPAWVANDPYVHAEKLRGIDLYIANGNGLPGPYDTLNGPNVNGDPGYLASQIVTGGVIEAATNQCAHMLQTKLDALGIPATYNFRDNGTHSWGYWQDNLHESWPLLASSLGA